MLQVVARQSDARRGDAPGGDTARSSPGAATGATDWVLLVLVAALTFAHHWLLAAAQPVDSDYWWHIRTGQAIAESGLVPHDDPFSATMRGAPWTAHEWLTDLVMYETQRRLGYAGNVALFGAINGAAAGLTFVACHRRGLTRVPAVATAVWAASLLLGPGAVRVQAITTLGVTVLGVILAPTSRSPRGTTWLVPPLLLCWSNLHGGFVLGLVLLLLRVVGDVVDRRSDRGNQRWVSGLFVLGAALVCSMASPYGLAALVYPVQYVDPGSASLRYIAEWQSPDFHQPETLLFAISILVVAWLAIGRWYLRTADALWGAATLALALISVRNLPLYAVIAGPMIGARLQSELLANRQGLGGWRDALSLVVVGGVVLATALPLLGANDPQRPLHFGDPPPRDSYPVAAISYLRLRAGGGTIFNEYAWGGYLIYELFPQYRVFIDGRADVYGELVGLHLRAVRAEPGWRRLLDLYDVDFVLVARDRPLAEALATDPEWRLVVDGDAERLFARTGRNPSCTTKRQSREWIGEISTSECGPFVMGRATLTLTLVSPSQSL